MWAVHQFIILHSNRNWWRKKRPIIIHSLQETAIKYIVISIFIEVSECTGYE